MVIISFSGGNLLMTTIRMLERYLSPAMTKCQ